MITISTYIYFRFIFSFISFKETRKKYAERVIENKEDVDLYMQV
jgi:hypothetical protein